MTTGQPERDTSTGTNGLGLRDKFLTGAGVGMYAVGSVVGCVVQAVITLVILGVIIAVVKAIF